MKFNSKTGSKAGKISKRGSALPIDLRGGLIDLVNRILKDIDYDSLTNNQRLKLLDIALKHSLPKLSIEKPYEEPEPPQEIQITIVDSNGNKKVSKKKLDENFKFKDLAG